MILIFQIILFMIGLILLVKGSDFFIKSSAAIAKRFGVSEFVIGLTLVACGTSLPELASSVAAALKHQSGIVIGNIVGSNIANVGLILGMAAAITSIKTKEEMLRRDGYIMLFAAVLLYVFMLDKVISRLESGILLLLFVVYLLFLFQIKQKLSGSYHFKEFIIYFMGFGYLKTIKSRAMSLNIFKKKSVLFGKSFFKDVSIILFSMFAIVFGAKFLVDSAIFFANHFQVPDIVIGLSVVAVGTSLPELAVSIMATIKGYHNIAVGNIIGSNIANIFLIIGVSGMVFPLEVIKSTLVFDAPFMILMSVLLLIFVKSNWKLGRLEGIILLVLYILFMSVLFMYKSLFSIL